MGRETGEAPRAETDLNQGSATASIFGGIVIPAVAAPLVALALPVAFVLSWSILSDLLGREIRWYERDRGGMRMMADAVTVIAVGAIAVAVAGVPLVKYFFRRARAKLLYRVGAFVLFLISTAFWLWTTRNHPEYQFTTFFVALLGWAGSLLGLSVATWETDEGKLTRAAQDARIEDEQSVELAALRAELAATEPADPEPSEARGH